MSNRFEFLIFLFKTCSEGSVEIWTTTSSITIINNTYNKKEIWIHDSPHLIKERPFY